MTPSQSLFYVFTLALCVTLSLAAPIQHPNSHTFNERHLSRRALEDERHVESHSFLQPHGSRHSTVVNDGNGNPISSHFENVDETGSLSVKGDHHKGQTVVKKHDAQGRLTKMTTHDRDFGFRVRTKYNPENGKVIKHSNAFKSHHGVWSKVYTKHNAETGAKEKVGIKMDKTPAKEYDHTPELEGQLLQAAQGSRNPHRR